MFKDNFFGILEELSIDGLMNLAKDLRAQVGAGLLSNKEAHDKINAISIVVMKKQLKENGIMSDEEYEEYLWKEKEEGGQSEGDELMTSGWEN